MIFYQKKGALSRKKVFLFIVVSLLFVGGGFSRLGRSLAVWMGENDSVVARGV